MRPRIAILLVGALLFAAGCGGGGGSSAPGTAAGGAVATAHLAQKIGLVSNGEGEYRLGDCTAKALLTSPARIEKARAAGKDVVTDPSGRYGVELEDPAGCGQVMRAAVGTLNVP